MANQRSTFAKRARESDLKDRARAKEARRAAKRDEQRPGKGPQIDWDTPGGVGSNEDVAPSTPPPAGNNGSSNDTPE